SDIDELEVGRWWKKIRIKKIRNLPNSQSTHTKIITIPEEKPDENKTKPSISVEQKNEKENSYYEIKSPMVGTFYRAPSPDSEPYVKEGDRVRVGQVLCIIEAMKLMNEIESDVNGTIVKILTENAQPVEYNQSLFLIER
ncbi:acetyl-CoA carboxylase biotin carboxyl carrier protein, partial [candidate division KSB1 bacterium]